MCSDIVDMLKTDLSNFLFPQWHDESYMNKWVLLNKDKVNKDLIMTVVDNQLSDTRFIKLIAKFADIAGRTMI